jgi:hypothetical protein
MNEAAHNDNIRVQKIAGRIENFAGITQELQDLRDGYNGEQPQYEILEEAAQQIEDACAAAVEILADFDQAPEYSDQWVANHIDKPMGRG